MIFADVCKMAARGEAWQTSDCSVRGRRRGMNKEGLAIPAIHASDTTV